MPWNYYIHPCVEGGGKGRSPVVVRWQSRGSWLGPAEPPSLLYCTMRSTFLVTYILILWTLIILELFALCVLCLKTCAKGGKMCSVQTVYNLLGRLWGYLNVHSVPSGVDDMQCIVQLWRLVMWKLQILLRQEAMCSVLMCFRRWWGGNVVGHDTSPGPDPAPCIINRRDLIHHQCCVLHKKNRVRAHLCRT